MTAEPARSGRRTLQIDSGVATSLAQTPAAVRELESRGFAGCWVGEVARDPFLPLTLAAEHTDDIVLGTNIAVAFARNPMSVATLAWDLQDFSNGRFHLGLGTQIKPHIEKRFGMVWSEPVARMREFITALRAIWTAWEEGTQPDFAGRFYTHTVSSPMFTPDPIGHRMPPVLLAAVGEKMTRMCGEVADGILTHPFTTREFLSEVTLSTITDGLVSSGRTRDEFQVVSPVFVVTGDDDEMFDEALAATRRRIAFYGSTPAYRKVLELHGWGELQTDLRELSLRNEWERMGALITDEMLSAFAVVAPVDEVAEGLRARCEGIVDRAVPTLPKDLSVESVSTILADFAPALSR